MSSLPYPSEPSRESIKEYGKSYDDGVADFWGFDSTDEAAVAKQGVIEYLSERWKHNSISHNDISSACGAANTPIENWYNCEAEWGEVVKRVESSLDTKLE